MPSFIINSAHFHQQNNVHHHATGQPQQEELSAHIGRCLRHIPPKQLCRCLRETFLLNWESLQQSTPDFKNLVTEMAILMARLDATEDGRE